MERLVISGGKKLGGFYTLPAAKNALLPIAAAALMTDGECRIKNCPDLSDVSATVDIIKSVDSCAVMQEGTLTICYRDSNKNEIDEKLCGRMRSSILYLAPLLYRKGSVKMYCPGGCTIGERPVDIHLDGLEKMGAQIQCEGGAITVQALNGLKGAQIKLRLPSVGATQTLIMAAATAKGLTVLKNCAREPEIVDLARFLNSAGAKITGAGRHEVIIQGVPCLTGVEYTPIPDRIVAATVLAAVNSCKGWCVIKNYPHQYMAQFENMLTKTGLKLVRYSDNILVYKYAHRPSPTMVHTGYYPAFSTDMGPLLAAAMANNTETVEICETVFENRFSYGEDFKKLGICCTTKGGCFRQNMCADATDCHLCAKDLRAGAALVVAALSKKGHFTLDGVNYIDRGYENIETIFKNLGADIRRIQLDQTEEDKTE
ncbi:MAG: UDP-N-acetylglucosamine 1-carboxyvinyltransferase [Oscillospiraceae bacterium]|nr:UDP-N-acetylglucosamine 1-carboxyvinyltransferase [Oscillospiraceae bacterium]